MTITISHSDTDNPHSTDWEAAAGHTYFVADKEAVSALRRAAQTGDCNYPPMAPSGGFDYINACGPEEPPTPHSSWCEPAECGDSDHWGAEVEVDGLEKPLFVRTGRYDSTDDFRHDGTVGAPFVQIRTDSDALFSNEEGSLLQGMGLGLVAMETGTEEVPALCAALLRVAAAAEGTSHLALLEQVVGLLAADEDDRSEATDSENDTIPGEIAIPGGPYVPGPTVRE